MENSNKYIPIAFVVLASVLGLLLVFSSIPASAHCAGRHIGDHPHCDEDRGGQTTGSLRVEVDFIGNFGNDYGSIVENGTLYHDELGAYTDGVDKVTALIDGWFRMVPGKNSPRTITVDLGPVYSCGSGDKCIADAHDGSPVVCPLEVDAYDRCIAARRVELYFERVFSEDSSTTSSILAMEVGDKAYGDHRDAEIVIRSDSRRGADLHLIFKESDSFLPCETGGENLHISAGFNEQSETRDWNIATGDMVLSSTGGGGNGPFLGGTTGSGNNYVFEMSPKIACLVSVSDGNWQHLGFVSMEFMYHIVALE